MQTPQMKKAIVHNAETLPPLNGDWDHPCWRASETILINHFRPESGDHRPTTEARIVFSHEGLHLIFRVQDQYVRCVQTALNGPVCTDSCVEFFVQPLEQKGYLNFELNCGGTLHASYIADPTRTDSGFADCSLLSEADAARVDIFHSMPSVVEPELRDPTTWVNQIFIPFALFSNCVGELGPIRGQTWRANFYKCGDKTSHPHWAAWSPVRELNFHDPECFGEIVFEG
jgi:hypothetical protein